MKKVKRIFLDQDGPLADWVGSAAPVFGVEPVDLDWSTTSDLAKALGISTNEMWRIDALGEDFWANLKPHPWAQELWRRAVVTAPTVVLTTPSHHPSSLAGKLRWMNRHLGNGKPFRDYLIGPRKEMCAAPGSLLVDDRASTCRKFRDAGGLAVLFPRPWNHNAKDWQALLDNPMGALEGWL